MAKDRQSFPLSEKAHYALAKSKVKLNSTFFP